MQPKRKHHSINRDYLIQTINGYSTSFSAKDIQATLSHDGKHISLSTLYRLLDEFTANGLIAKDISNNGTANYRRVETCETDEHCYLQCTKCHKTTHIDCVKIAKLSKHLSKKHNFSVNNSSLVIYGTCEECR